jgi:hypothetical protein
VNTTESKRRYLAVKIFGSIFIVSAIFILVSFDIEEIRELAEAQHITRPTPRPSPQSKNPPVARPNKPLDLADWILKYTATISAIGTILSILLAWGSDRRLVIELVIKNTKLERELEDARKKMR